MGLFERLEGVEGQLDPLLAANPAGRNGYDNGMSFEESTGGVERDSSGRFAPEAGSKRSRRSRRLNPSRSDQASRAARRRSSVQRAKAERAAKKSKSGLSEAEKAKREAQRQELANLSLQISEANAAGNRVLAAELRVQRAEKALSFADTALERTNAQTALNNAKASLARVYESERERNKRKASKGAKIESREEGF